VTTTQAPLAPITMSFREVLEFEAANTGIASIKLVDGRVLVVSGPIEFGPGWLIVHHGHGEAGGRAIVPFTAILAVNLS
jgi:hypothetical protein